MQKPTMTYKPLQILPPGLPLPDIALTYIFLGSFYSATLVSFNKETRLKAFAFAAPSTGNAPPPICMACSLASFMSQL